MNTKEPTAANTVIIANDPKDWRGILRCVGGSRSDHWNHTVINQTVR
jgi:hypothetical protein